MRTVPVKVDALKPGDRIVLVRNDADRNQEIAEVTSLDHDVLTWGSPYYNSHLVSPKSYSSKQVMLGIDGVRRPTDADRMVELVLDA